VWLLRGLSLEGFTLNEKKRGGYSALFYVFLAGSHKLLYDPIDNDKR
jgi:hypothetical protein